MAKEFMTLYDRGRPRRYLPTDLGFRMARIYKQDPGSIVSRVVGISKTDVTASAPGRQWTFAPGNTRLTPKKYVRRIRPQEATKLDALDDQIRDLNRKRSALWTEAFKKGHIVSLAEARIA